MSLLRLGDRGPKVIDLQRLLNRRGFALVIDGDFGPKTERAVRDFQRQAGLVVDGIAGPKTFAVLRGGPKGGSWARTTSSAPRRRLGWSRPRSRP